VNCQGRSKEELVETLRVTLREALEFNRREALDAAGESYEGQEIAIWSAECCFGISVPMDAGMLTIARTLPQPPAALPFPGATFDVVLCQQGLRFFPDKPGALRDMRRVLVPTGRFVLSVWRGLSHCPWQRAVAEALERHVSAETAASIRAPSALGDMEELRALITGTGFHTVHIRTEGQLIRHASLMNLCWGICRPRRWQGWSRPWRRPRVRRSSGRSRPSSVCG
jgi:SAM-dependent methyltransferase